MGDLLRFESANGYVLVEERANVDLERVGLLDRIKPAKQRLEEAFAQIKPAIDAALAAVRTLTASPEEVEVELGVTLTAEAGAIVARTAAEGHLLVRVTWRPNRGDLAAHGNDETSPTE